MKCSTIGCKCEAVFEVTTETGRYPLCWHHSICHMWDLQRAADGTLTVIRKLDG